MGAWPGVSTDTGEGAMTVRSTDFDAMRHMLVYRRRHLGMSKSALVREIGVTYESVSRWENGLTIPSGIYLFAWARALGLQLSLEKRNDG
jgi:DNA-binding XRE family transcriptional regulator